MSFSSNFSIRSIIGEEAGTASGDSNMDRPKYSYGALIMMALKTSPSGRLTLAEIYDFIKNHFPYYRTCKTDWQNAIRNNLSLSEHFVRLARECDDPGRGGYWTLAPQYQQLCIGNDTGRLRQPPAPPAPPMNCHYVPVPAFHGMAYLYRDCGLPGCMCYQTLRPIFQVQQMYFNMQ
ncbi:unnamed protein product [Hermetia illucens]|uniref:Fork-head domain-containing protein n=1 Tax=Hermetia illucens TaxID=343691 RepID=A0A7R8UG31_HERIL|nr:fork head domain transcription factor slp1-like [Hermetia illucens]CAD7079372.1 unnamed protein product [Hermetia illucens]